jgi:hypothetical protein
MGVTARRLTMSFTGRILPVMRNFACFYPKNLEKERKIIDIR